MDLAQVKEYLGQDWEKVQSKISELLKSDIDILNKVNDRILAHSGKQLRPLLAVLVARACSGGELTSVSVNYAAAAELLHNATLLHDDVADSSEERRGVPTIMSMMGPSVSVLVGDFWLVKAMESILFNDSPLCSEVIRLFSRTLCNLAEGEMLQLQKADTGDTTEKDYERIIYNKTASLFEASAVSAAISVGADERTQEAVRDYAVSLGMAFQIRDDIFDYLPSSSQVGKPVGVDIMEQKMTLPLLGAMHNAGPEAEKKVRGMVSELHSHPEYRDEIISLVRSCGGIEYAGKRLEEYVSNAIKALDILPDGKEKSYLEELAHYTGRRMY